MGVFSFGRTQKAAILAPLTALSAVCTATLLNVGGPVEAARADGGTLPDGTALPAATIDAPASVSQAGFVAPGVPTGMTQQAISTASASGIPAAALNAYQRAASVINAADTTCQLPWQLVGAIGRVESDHGRANGNTLNDKGVATPGIYGPQLNGRNGTQAIRDTDGGQFDRDTKFDRAVGPMQFIPSTWQIVGVDGDNDGLRNPQDINDAALATAVYLCSGDSNLSTTAGQRAAVMRYNHSQDYVNLVLAIMNAYESGDFTSVPNTYSSVGFNFPVPGAVIAAARPHQKQTHKPSRHHSGSTTPSGPAPAPAPVPTAPAPTAVAPSQQPSLPLPTKSLPVPLPTSALPNPTSALPQPLTQAQAEAQCLAQLGLTSVPALGPLLTQYQDCMAKLGF